MNNDPTLVELIQAVNQIAKTAGEKIMNVYMSDDFAVEQKTDDSPLTRADTAAHNAIVQALQALTPSIPVLSEESSTYPFNERQQWSRYWLVDPLDGTREFIKRNGEFTVNIALIDQHRPVLGSVYVPVTEINYYAVDGVGAFKCLADAEPQSIQVRVSPTDNLKIAGSRSHASENLQKFLATLDFNYELVSIGSSLKICLVAEGEADIYPRFGPTSEWDTAAAQCVVEQAGGQLTDIHMQPLRYNTKESLLNPYFLVFGDATRDWSKYLPDVA